MQYTIVCWHCQGVAGQGATLVLAYQVESSAEVVYTTGVGVDNSPCCVTSRDHLYGERFVVKTSVSVGGQSDRQAVFSNAYSNGAADRVVLYIFTVYSTNPCTLHLHVTTPVHCVKYHLVLE